jgi:hypothetical protein
MQTNDTLLVANKEFNDFKKQELKIAACNAKLEETLTIKNEVTFSNRILKKLAISFNFARAEELK